MGKVKNAERDKQIREMAMTEDITTIAQIVGVSKERIRQVLFAIPQETKDRILALHSCEDYTNEMISGQLQVPLVTVEYVINNPPKNGANPCPQGKVEISVEKTEDVEWERTEQPGLIITDMSIQIILRKTQVQNIIRQWLTPEMLKDIIQDWLTKEQIFKHPVQVTDLKDDPSDDDDLVINLHM